MFILVERLPGILILNKSHAIQMPSLPEVFEVTPAHAPPHTLQRCGLTCAIQTPCSGVGSHVRCHTPERPLAPDSMPPWGQVPLGFPKKSLRRIP